MPYITQKQRDSIRSGNYPLNAGELNYVFCNMALSEVYLFNHDQVFQVCTDYLRYTKHDYQHMNDVVGALSGAYAELLRRGQGPHTMLMRVLVKFQDEIVAPYEDQKIKENGDII